MVVRVILEKMRIFIKGKFKGGGQLGVNYLFLD